MDSLTYTYSGQNTYTYSGQHTYTYSQGSGGDAYGFNGFPGNPMLSAGTNGTRAAVAAKIPFSDLHRTIVGALQQNDAKALGRYGGQVRTSMALFELLSGLSFEMLAGGVARLWAPSGRDNAHQLRPLVDMSRPPFAYFKHQVTSVDAMASRRDDRMAEVLTQVAPPLAYFVSLLSMQPERQRKSLEFVNAVLQMAYSICMRFKHALAVARPSELSFGISAMIEVPMHPAMPAGHAVESHLTAALLGKLAGAGPTGALDHALRLVAFRISENRVVAGLHYPADLVAGRLLADALASYVFALIGAAETWQGGMFDGASRNAAQGDSDALRDDQASVVARFNGDGCATLGAPMAAPDLAPVLRQMWHEAKKEWEERVVE